MNKIKLNLLEKIESWFKWYYSEDGQKGSSPPFSSGVLMDEIGKEIDRQKGVFVNDAPLEDFSKLEEEDQEYKSSVRELSKWLNEGRCDIYPVDKQALAVILSRAQINIDKGEY